jgi:ComF family protein
MPGSCLLCDAPNNHHNLDLCVDCKQELPYLANVCTRCSLPLPDNVTSICGQCQLKPPHYDHTISLFNYAMPVDKLVQRLKFNEKLVIARTLGGLFAERIDEHTNNFEPQCIIPVPLHKNRLRQRGFNQALELARPVASRRKIKIDNTSCKRIIDTEAQSSLPADERHKNVRHAFSVDTSIDYQRVVLFDDVMTTGQTVNALAKALKKQGVEEVAVWSITRALPRH